MYVQYIRRNILKLSGGKIIGVKDWMVIILPVQSITAMTGKGLRTRMTTDMMAK
jgi:hypothetical protein